MICKLALAVLCIAALAVADSDSGSHELITLRVPKGRSSHRSYAPAPAPAPRRVVYKYAPAPAPAPRKVYKYAPAPAPAYHAEPEYNDDAKYQFAYQVKAGGPVKTYGGYGSDSGEGYGKVAHVEAEFGHAESRDYGKTQGKYFVQLPDGRLQTVNYHVDGDSGYIAEVKYD